MDVKRLQLQLREFAKERDWEKFHSPKNIAMALSVEAAELMELFQWLTEEESFAITQAEEDAARVKEELADVLLYLLRLADLLKVDLSQAAAEKMAVNARKYPVALAHGRATKHDRLNTSSN